MSWGTTLAPSECDTLCANNAIATSQCESFCNARDPCSYICVRGCYCANKAIHAVVIVCAVLGGITLFALALLWGFYLQRKSDEAKAAAAAAAVAASPQAASQPVAVVGQVLESQSGPDNQEEEFDFYSNEPTAQPVAFPQRPQPRHLSRQQQQQQQQLPRRAVVAPPVAFYNYNEEKEEQEAQRPPPTAAFANSYGYGTFRVSRQMM